MSDKTATDEELSLELKEVRLRQRQIVAEMNRRYELKKREQNAEIIS